MFKPIGILCLLFLIFSCSKGDSDTSSLTLLQNKWLIDSVYVYPASGMSSPHIYAAKPTDMQYVEFKTDGKVYSYGSNPALASDTSAYHLLADNKTFLVNLIENGVVSAKSDTGYILKLTSTSFAYYTRTPDRKYGKAVLKR